MAKDDEWPVFNKSFIKHTHIHALAHRHTHRHTHWENDTNNKEEINSKERKIQHKKTDTNLTLLQLLNENHHNFGALDKIVPANDAHNLVELRRYRERIRNEQNKKNQSEYGYRNIIVQRVAKRKCKCSSGGNNNLKTGGTKYDESTK